MYALFPILETKNILKKHNLTVEIDGSGAVSVNLCDHFVQFLLKVENLQSMNRKKSWFALQTSPIFVKTHQSFTIVSRIYPEHITV